MLINTNPVGRFCHVPCLGSYVGALIMRPVRPELTQNISDFLRRQLSLGAWGVDYVVVGDIHYIRLKEDLC